MKNPLRAIQEKAIEITTILTNGTNITNIGDAGAKKELKELEIKRVQTKIDNIKSLSTGNVAISTDQLQHVIEILEDFQSTRDLQDEDIEILQQLIDINRTQ